MGADMTSFPPDEPDTIAYAFPVPLQNRGRGMTLRQYTAIQAMVGLLACETTDGQPWEKIARSAHMMADAMIEEGKKP
jgi:hypothetical protein